MSPLLKKRRINKAKTKNSRHKRPKKIIKPKRRPPTGEQYLALMIMSGVLLTASVVTYLSIYAQGMAAQNRAETLLTEYDALVEDSSLPKTTPDSQSEAPAPSAATPEDPGPLIYVDGYDIIGKLMIEDLELELPVIAETTTNGLKTSICYYEGALPGEAGNMILTGHNFANGAHFGNLHRVDVGDSVDFLATDGTLYQYRVYETLGITPDDTAALQRYQGNHALTLLTCASHGNRRLIVRCKLVEG